jgi:hypothetical protein
MPPEKAPKATPFRSAISSTIDDIKRAFGCVVGLNPIRHAAS